jgi:hypothetical protein
MDENLNQEVIAQEPGAYVEDPLPIPTVYANVLPEEVEKYREFVVHYFDNQMNKDILMLQGEDKNRMFQMLTDYADILEKIFHDGIPILEHIQDKRWSAANRNPHTGINWEYSCPIIREYEIWKKEKEAAAAVNDEPAES